jgi:hypothetical protein
VSNLQICLVLSACLFFPTKTIFPPQNQKADQQILGNFERVPAQFGSVKMLRTSSLERPAILSEASRVLKEKENVLPINTHTRIEPAVRICSEGVGAPRGIQDHLQENNKGAGNSGLQEWNSLSPSVQNRIIMLESEVKNLHVTLESSRAENSKFSTLAVPVYCVFQKFTACLSAH